MLDDVRRCQAGRLHLMVDTKVEAVSGGRGITTIAALMKRDVLSKTDLVLERRGNAGLERGAKRGRVQGLGNVTHAQPLAHGIIGGEDKDNHVHLFRYLEYLWDTVQPHRRLQELGPVTRE